MSSWHQVRLWTHAQPSTSQRSVARAPGVAVDGDAGLLASWRELPSLAGATSLPESRRRGRPALTELML